MSISPDHWQHYYDCARRNDELHRGLRPQFTPAMLFELATHNSVVATFLQMWRAGYMSFEETLIALVSEFAHANELMAKRELTRYMGAGASSHVIRAGRGFATVPEPPNHDCDAANYAAALIAMPARAITDAAAEKMAARKNLAVLDVGKRETNPDCPECGGTGEYRGSLTGGRSPCSLGCKAETA